MILRSSPFSPFGRKVQIAGTLLGLSGQIEIVTADPGNAADPLQAENPLGKIPVLILDDGTAIFDSPVIVEYLNSMATAHHVIPNDGRRFAALRLQALADGMMEAAALQISERRFHPKDQRSIAWLDRQAGKVEHALAALESEAVGFNTKNVDIGQVAIACALGYLDLRFNGAWREKHPKLVAFLSVFAKAVPPFAETQSQALAPT